MIKKIKTIQKQIQDRTKESKLDLNNIKNKVMLVNFDGCSHAYLAIINLLKEDFTPEAGTLIRFLLEAYVDLALIFQDTSDDYANKYINFHNDSAFALNEAVKKISIDCLSKQPNWLGAGFKKRVQMVKSADSKEFIIFAYTLLCQHSHPTYAVLGSRLCFNSQDFDSRKEYLSKKNKSFELIATNLIDEIYYLVATFFGYSDIVAQINDVKAELINKTKDL